MEEPTMPTATLAFLFALLLLLLSPLAREYIPSTCLLFALLFSLTTISAQRRALAAQHRTIEKREDEYHGQVSINRACAERHKAAAAELKRKLLAASAEKPCICVHYEDRDVVAEGMVTRLRETNADLTQRVVTLLKRDAVMQERLDVGAAERETSRAELKRITDEMALWRAEALEYEKLWKREGEKNRSRPAAATAAETKACHRTHYEDHDVKTQQVNEELQRVVVDLRQQAYDLQMRDGRFQEAGHRIQQERNELRAKKERLESEVKELKNELFVSDKASRNFERAWRREVENRRAARNNGAEV